MFCMHPSLHYKTTLHIDYTTQTVYKSMTYYSCKKTVILVTHDISEAIAMTDRVLILTNRPASLLKTVDIKSRDTLSTQKYFDEIREVLK